MVLVALVILGGVVIFVAWMVNNSDYDAKRRSLKRDSDIKNLKNSLDVHFLQENLYPFFEGCINGDDDLTRQLYDKGVMRPGALVADPLYPSDPEHCYYYSGGGGTYSIRIDMERVDEQGNAIYQYVQP